jgi:hypothetical protein
VRAARAPAAGRPTVLVLADICNEQFDQVSSSLRRRGLRVLRVHTGSREDETGPGRARTRWLRDRLLYDGCILLSDAADPASPKLARERIVDVLFNEPTAAFAGLEDPRILRLAARSLAFAQEQPRLILDKFAVNAHLERHGVRIPAQLCAAKTSAAEAVARLGLPLIVKARNGAAGGGVRLAESLEAVEQAARELRAADGTPAFYQQHIPGDMVMYGTVFAADEPRIEHGLKVLEALWPLGPSARVQLFDDPDLLQAGRAAMRALGSQGFAEIGFIRDAEGRYWHIDANIRGWGNMVSLLALGVDYAQAYAALVAGAPCDGGARALAETPAAEVMPYALYRALAQGSAREVGDQLRCFLEVCRRGPGPRYAAVIAVKATGVAVGRACRELARLVRRRR